MAMRTVVLGLAGCLVLSACVTSRPALAPVGWEQRRAQLQHALSFELNGRAAVAVAAQGWQASLTWREQRGAAELHLAGPLGVGAVVLTQTPQGLSLNGAPPSDAVVAQLQDRLGFVLPLDALRFWLLGVPDPSDPADVARNALDRAQQFTQAGWTVSYDKYMTVAGDLLPARLVLTREDVRVRIAVDHWVAPQ
jgi:outer membrane lipoprotein LolB